MSMRIQYCFFLVILIFFQACKKESNPEETGKIQLVWEHYSDTANLRLNNMIYRNAAGNDYEVTGLKYFISDLTLYARDKEPLVIDDYKAIHYVDIGIPYTLTWDVYDPVKEGAYDSLSFIFGLTESRNISFMFVNPPEVNMFWPEVLGGGYHYLMLDGKWRSESAEIMPFNFHLGIGQIYEGNTTNTDSITGFVQNYFRVLLPASAFSVQKGYKTVIVISMNVKSWFDTPNVFDLNHWGGAIMQNQEAMHTAKENGWDVFSVDSVCFVPVY